MLALHAGTLAGYCLLQVLHEHLCVLLQVQVRFLAEEGLMAVDELTDKLTDIYFHFQALL